MKIFKIEIALTLFVSIFSFTVVAQNYCEPDPEFGCDGVHYIQDVELIGETVSLVNSSECEDGYIDNTGMSAPDLLVGTTYPIEIGVDNNLLMLKKLRVWIDLNDDGEFDEQDELFIDEENLQNATDVYNLQIPTDATPGTYRMRIKVDAGPAQNYGACEAGMNGETEDYHIEIIQEEEEFCDGTPEAGSSGLDSVFVCPSTDFSLMVSQFSEDFTTIGISIQWQSSPAAENDWTDIANGNETTLEIQNGITEETDFRYIITCDLSNESDTSAIYEVRFLPGNQCYCTPEYTEGCEDGDAINAVNLIGETIELNNITGCSPDGYGNYTGTNFPDLLLGESYHITIGTDANNPADLDVRAWIDYNNDGVFEEDEEIANTIGNGFSNSSQTFSFEVPEDIDPGMYRMRVKLEEMDGTSIEACADAANGETEDYTVNLIEEVIDPCEDGMPNIDGILVEETGANEYYFEAEGLENVDEITWDFGDGTTQSEGVDTLSHTYADDGEYTVTVIVGNECGADTFSITLMTAGIEEFNAIEKEFKLFPNPATDEVVFENHGTTNVELLAIRNSLGQIVETIHPTQKQTVLSLTSYTTGMYWIEIKTQSKVIVKKLTIIK